jgi:hypothetical protein
MKNVIYKKRELPHKGRAISIREQFADAESSTRVMKNFIYLISRVDEIPGKIPVPEIRVAKYIDTASKTEAFLFKVKGEIYVKEKRFNYRVSYSHSLFITMIWTTHVLSSKPAALA